jgi:hypothetical protein
MRTADDIVVEDPDNGWVYVYGYAEGESEPVQEVLVQRGLRADGLQATDANIAAAQQRVADEINRRNAAAVS